MTLGAIFVEIKIIVQYYLTRDRQNAMHMSPPCVSPGQILSQSDNIFI